MTVSGSCVMKQIIQFPYLRLREFMMLVSSVSSDFFKNDIKTKLYTFGYKHKNKQTSRSPMKEVDFKDTRTIIFLPLR